MKIFIVEWCGEGLQGTHFENENSRIVEGTHSDVFDIAKELFCSGKNKNITPESVIVAVDTKRYQQR